MTLPRYIIDWAYQNDELHSNGEWCKWKDVAPLLARIEQLEKELSDLRIEYASKA